MLDTPNPSAKSTLRLQQLLPQLFDAHLPTGDRYLKFEVAPDVPALIALADVQESAQIPSHRVTPLPNLPAGILGLMNARNQVLCVVDLAQILQIPTPWIHRQGYSVVTVRLASTSEMSEETPLLALMLHRIQGIVRLQSGDMQSPVDKFAPTLTPFLRGCVVQDAQSIPVLDIQAIAAAPMLNSR